MRFEGGLGACHKHGFKGWGGQAKNIGWKRGSLNKFFKGTPFKTD